MDVALLVLRISLGLVFAAAGAAKIASQAETRRALAEFGVAERWVPVGGVLLPAAELSIAVLLFPTATARIAAIAGFVLMAVFSCAIARLLRHRVAADCNCFGALGEGTVGRPALVRNGILAALFVTVALGGPGAAPSPLVAGATAVAAVVLGQSWLILRLLRANGRLQERVSALEPGSVPASAAGSPSSLPVGAPAPPLTVSTEHGPRSLPELLSAGLPLALVFSNPGCAECHAVDASLQMRAEEFAGRLRIRRVQPGDVAPEQARSYRVHTVPSAVVIGPDERLATPLVVGERAVLDLLTGYRSPSPPLMQVR